MIWSLGTHHNSSDKLSDPSSGSPPSERQCPAQGQSRPVQLGTSHQSCHTAFDSGTAAHHPLAPAQLPSGPTVLRRSIPAKSDFPVPIGQDHLLVKPRKVSASTGSYTRDKRVPSRPLERTVLLRKGPDCTIGAALRRPARRG